MTDLTKDDIKLMQWAIQVAKDALVIQADEKVAKEDATRLIMRFSELEEKILKI